MNYFEFCKQYYITLNKEQEKAVKHINGPLLVISVPGSGKTTVIITRIAYMILCRNIPGNNILTVTFSVDAASEMKNRFLEKFGISVLSNTLPEFRTLHSLALNIVKKYCSEKKMKYFNIITDNYAVIGKLVKEYLCIEYYNDKTVKDISNCISRHRNLLKIEDMKDIVIDGVNTYQIYKTYTDLKRIKHEIDFDDILIYALKILENHPDILNSFQEKYKYINVDEAQDNSFVQNRIIELLASKNNDLFMVGDEDQCIYGFRGAFPESFFEFEKKWGSDSIIKLQTNYRSCDKILDSAEKFIKQNKNRYPKALKGIKKETGIVAVKNFYDSKQMNEYIVKDIFNHNSCAVLARNNISLLTTAYELYNSKIDFKMRPFKNELFHFFPINDIIFLIKCGLGIGTVQIPLHLRPLLDKKRFIRHLRTLAPADAVRFIIEDMHYSKIMISKYKERHSPQELCSKLNVLDYIACHHKHSNVFIKDMINFENKIISGCNKGTVSLLTCHGAKGLEFDKVYILEVSENIFPSCDISEDENEYLKLLEEDVRLFYVAMTRARESFEVLNVKNTAWGESIPSIFVKHLERIIV